MYYSTYFHTIDNQGRMFIPAKFRTTPSFILTPGLGKYIVAYPPETWKRVLSQLIESSYRDFTKVYSGSAIEVVVDNQGRVTLPQNFRDHAGLNKEVAVVGVVDKIEIWDKDRWIAFKKQVEDQYVDLAEKIAKIEMGKINI